jgi:hypothetical protein
MRSTCEAVKLHAGEGKRAARGKQISVLKRLALVQGGWTSLSLPCAIIASALLRGARPEADLSACKLSSLSSE